MKQRVPFEVAARIVELSFPWRQKKFDSDKTDCILQPDRSPQGSAGSPISPGAAPSLFLPAQRKAAAADDKIIPDHYAR